MIIVGGGAEKYKYTCQDYSLMLKEIEVGEEKIQEFLKVCEYEMAHPCRQAMSILRDIGTKENIVNEFWKVCSKDHRDEVKSMEEHKKNYSFLFFEAINLVLRSSIHTAHSVVKSNPCDTYSNMVLNLGGSSYTFWRVCIDEREDHCQQAMSMLRDIGMKEDTVNAFWKVCLEQNREKNR